MIKSNAQRIDSDNFDGEILPSLIAIAKLSRFLMTIRLAELGLFNGQDELLLALEDGTPRTVSDLAKIIDVRPPTVSKMLDRLEEQDLAKRGHGTDRRETIVTLTRLGMRRREEITAARICLEAEFRTSSETGSLGETKAALLRTEEALRRMIVRVP
jgi:DNA-binding MarR family transcriptional regulator